MKTIIRNPNWWGRWAGLQRCLTTVLVFACAAIIGLVSGVDSVLLKHQITKEITSAHQPLVLQSSKAKTQYEGPKVDRQMQFLAEYKRENICRSPECMRMASKVLFKMNKKIDPCNNFYQFACGNDVAKSQTTQDTKAVNTFPAISDKWLFQLRTILTEEQPHTQPKHRRLPNILYKACMNLTTIKKLGTRYINRISKSLGGWPVLYGSSWDRDNTWTWPDLVRKFRRIGYSSNSVVYLSIGMNLQNNTRRIISLDQSFLGLNRETLIKGLNATYVLAYYDYMIDIAVLFGAERKAAQRELMQSLKFEIDLAKISTPDRTKIDYNNVYNLRTIKQLQASYPYVQWLDYINAHMPDGHKVDENEVINLSMPSFFDDLGNLLARTKKRVIANHMMWHFYGLSVSFLTEKLRKRHVQYTTILSGNPARKPRWKECVHVVLSCLPLAVGSLYERKYFDQESKPLTLEMVNNTRSAFSQILDKVKWMDDKTKQEAKRKLQSIKVHIGYPDEMLAEAKLEDFYRKLEMDPNKYFESYLNFTTFIRDYLFGTLKMPASKTDWIVLENLVTATASYSPITNSLNYPVGIFQKPFFEVQRPKYMNYGTIGSMIGHEFTHGFDSAGRQFDGSGNAIDWWQADAITAYSEKTKCILEQYGQFADVQTGLSPDGVNIQSEYVADITGTKAAYLAYQQWVARNGEEPQLPGLNYTPQQMFWISVAQSWCVNYGSESQLDDYLPSEYRVLGTFRNLMHFSHDFQCRQKSPMNPTRKCEVW